MVDKKTEFVLSLQGKECAGHLTHWTIIYGELAGLMKSHKGPPHYHVLREYKISNDIAIGVSRYYTLGTECTHKEIMGIISLPAEGKYGIKDYG